jgi:polyisoprenoid-binding protein YceI
MSGTRIVDGREVPVAGSWSLDLDHTVLGFVARHMVFTKVRGRFNKFSGAIQIAERLEDSTVELEIQAASLTTEVAQRDAHLHSADFLDCDQFPVITYRSTKVDVKRLALIGDLTIKDITVPVNLDFTYEGVLTYPWGGSRAMFSAATEIPRKAWGITWNMALETGGWLVSENVVLEIEAQAILQEA